MLRIIPIESKVRNYYVEFSDSFSVIYNLIKEKNTITYIDSNIKNLYPELDTENSIDIECIENNKNLSGCEYIFDSLIRNKANINTKIIAIGGGILQDLVGFCASTFCRGIDYTLVPTTLLSQADSCIGGKTSLNFKNKKNILGTFYPPSKIIICEKFNETLSKLDYISGLGEIYKFHILQNIELKLPINNLLDTIQNCLTYKSSILSQDEFDKKERKILNFGHTFGHAIETSSEYIIPHGVSVIIGSMIALRLSKYLNYEVPLYDKYIELGIQLTKQTNIDFNSAWFDCNSLLEIVKSDKKNTGQLNMVLINSNPIVEPVTNILLLKKSIEKTYESI